MGLHLGFDAPSAQVVGLALRHAILPKQYSAAYKLQQVWDTYGLPQYLYTDGGKDFRSQHLEQVATELGTVLCLRRKPSDGGIVEHMICLFFLSFCNTTIINILDLEEDKEALLFDREQPRTIDYEKD